jgi:hypothetical protein
MKSKPRPFIECLKEECGDELYNHLERTGILKKIISSVHLYERDFKLLVREYFNANENYQSAINPTKSANAAMDRLKASMKIEEILDEFTKNEIEQLPF